MGGDRAGSPDYQHFSVNGWHPPDGWILAVPWVGGNATGARGGHRKRRWDVVRGRAGLAGLAAAVLGICGCAAAGFSHVPVPERHVTQASRVAPSVLAVGTAGTAGS